jgi:hypothetical protein
MECIHVLQFLCKTYSLQLLVPVNLALTPISTNVLQTSLMFNANKGRRADGKYVHQPLLGDMNS